MAREIECIGENFLEDFIKYGDQIPYYQSFQGGPNPHSSKRVQNYYILGKKFAKIFDKGEDFLESLKKHIENCNKCSKTMIELKEKYSKLEIGKIEKLDEQHRFNLKYFGLI